MKILRKIDPMSAARLAAIAGIIWGLVIGILVFLGTGIADSMGRLYVGYEGIMPMVGVAAIIALPIGYGITGFISAYVGAMLYNFVAKKFGGIKIDLK